MNGNLRSRVGGLGLGGLLACRRVMVLMVCVRGITGNGGHGNLLIVVVVLLLLLVLVGVVVVGLGFGAEAL